jgi:hypothetical protein
MRSGRRLIHIVADTEPANSADRIQTLLKSYKAAVRGRTGSPSILCAPRIILRLGGCFNAEESYQRRDDGQQMSHERGFYKLAVLKMPGRFGELGRASARDGGTSGTGPNHDKGGASIMAELSLVPLVSGAKKDK